MIKKGQKHITKKEFDGIKRLLDMGLKIQEVVELSGRSEFTVYHIKNGTMTEDRFNPKPKQVESEPIDSFSELMISLKLLDAKVSRMLEEQKEVLRRLENVNIF